MFDDLRAFVAVIEHESVTRAADALSLTQSAVSRRIQHLEESLEARLFDRNSKPPKTTALGRRVYEQAIALLRAVDHLRDVAREGAEPNGIFRLGFTQMVADIVLFDAIMKMKAQFPALQVQLHTNYSSRLYRQVMSGRLDAATLMLPSPSSLPDGLAGQFITSFEVVIVESKRKPLIGRNGTLDALASQEWILNPEGCGFRSALERTMESAGKTLKPSVDTHGLEMQLRMVAAGLGLGLVPEGVLQRSRSCRELSVVSIPGFKLNMDIWLVHPLQLGNLRRAAEVLAHTVSEGLAEYAHTRAPKRRVTAR